MPDLKKCKKCGQEVENNIKKCPHCDTEYPTVSNKSVAIFFIVIIAIAVGIGSIFFGAPTKEEEQANFTAYYNKMVAITTEIDSIYEPIMKQIADGNMIEAVRLSQNAERAFVELNGELSRLKIPELISEDNNKAIKKAHDDLSYAFLLKAGISSKLIEYADTKKPSIVAEMQNDQATSQELLISSVGTISTIGINVGAIKQ
ncbi:MAG: zinc ribbon domain-containing protein [Deferribacterales bacterium]